MNYNVSEKKLYFADLNVLLYIHLTQNDRTMGALGRKSCEVKSLGKCLSNYLI